MCGIIAIYGKDPSRRARDEQEIGALLAGMLATLAKRGPDEQTHVQIGPAWLGHTRLSIIDLSTGTQPVYNEARTVATILNGEIYNYRELRDDLRRRGHEFRTESDTEVIAHLYEEYGEGLFSHLNGMFAAVVYDRERDIMLAGRDRLGEKPILYLDTPDHLVLASELKTLLQWPGVAREIDPQALALYFNMLCVPEPLCIFKGVVKLQPAHYLKVAGGRLTTHCYWQPDLAVDWSMDAATARERSLELLRDAVRMRMVADVPLGVFLSGGIDSSAVTAFAAETAGSRVRTFSIGLADEMDERPFARMVADRCGTDHTELFARGDVAEAFPLVMDYFDEPFADSSCVPTFLVSREAREHVKVALTGDGGDELFGGYTAYLSQAQLRGGRIGTKLSGLAGRLTGRPSPYPHAAGPWAVEHWLGMRSLVSMADLPKWLPGYGDDLRRFYRDHAWLKSANTDPLSVAFAHDLNFYLPADLLKKVDMAAMLTSLECRAPFLDHRLVEFSATIPPDLKLAGGSPKRLLKDALAGRLPTEVIERPKHGFGAPVTDWVQGPLRDIARELLGHGCRCESFVERGVIDRLSAEMAAGPGPDRWRAPLQYWSLLAFEWWLRRYA